MIRIPKKIKLRGSNPYPLYTLVVFILLTGLLLLTVTGDMRKLDYEYFKDPATSLVGHFENSSPRSRFALTYSIVEERSATLSNTLAGFATPDLAKTQTSYVSLFAPGTSILVIPGYIFGKYLLTPQLGTFLYVALFALINSLFIRSISIKIGANKYASSLAAFTFLAATPALTYAGVLYQHHFTVFLLLLCLYALLKFRPAVSLSIVWFSCALSIAIDNPNLFLFAPIGVYALKEIASIREIDTSKKIVFKPLLLLTFFTALLPLAMFLGYNQKAFGNKFQLAGTLVRVEGLVSEKNKLKAPNSDEIVNKQRLSEQISNIKEQEDKDAVGFFKTRLLLSGLYTHILSLDRGTINYAPVILLGLFAIPFMYRNKTPMLGLLITIVFMNLTLYSMWGDPWGGWSFGSRYLIPSFAILSILLAISLSIFRSNIFFAILYVVLLANSIHINVLGAVTTNNIPPQVEVLALEQVTGQVEKYTHERGYDYLNKNTSKSFVYNQFLAPNMRAWDYYHTLMYFYVTAGIILSVLYFVPVLVSKYLRKAK